MERLPDVGVLTFAGGMRPRNYAANPLEYRANSHFMYLTGASIPDAVLWMRAGRSELFIEVPDEDDALWHGPSLGTEALRARLGVDAVQPIERLQAALDSAGDFDRIASLPSPDPETRQRQASLLMRRGWSPTDFETDPESVDRTLALAMVEARLIHDEGAMECLRRAAEGTAAAHLAGMRATRPGLTEHAVRGAMEGAILSAGMVTSYPPIVTTRGEILHNNLHHHTMKDKDLMLADVGAEFEGWAGDVTRTWPVSGSFTPTQRAIVDLVLESQLKAIDMVRPGVRYRDIHLESARVLTQGLVDEGILRGEVDNLVERGAHALLFPHGVGHIIGLDVHDMEDLGDLAGYESGRSRAEQFGLGYLRLDRDLRPGMMVTIEPGFYIVPAILDDPKIAGPFVDDKTLDRGALARFEDVRGVRIEDDVLCTEGAPEVLTASIPKAAAEVEAVVQGR